MLFPFGFNVLFQIIDRGGYVMRRLTLMLFQLFLSIFAVYAVLYDVPNEYLFVPLLCLVAMFFLGRHPGASSEKSQERILADT
jgi:hypothetical protein